MIVPDSLKVEKLNMTPADFEAGRVRFRVTALALSPEVLLAGMLADARNLAGMLADARNEGLLEGYRQGLAEAELALRDVASTPGVTERLMAAETYINAWGSDPNTTTTEGNNHDRSDHHGT